MMLVLLVLAVGLSTLTRSCSARIDISISDPLDDCGSIVLQVNCSSIPSEYRHITGACNNLNYPSLGAAMTPFRRLIPKREVRYNCLIIKKKWNNGCQEPITRSEWAALILGLCSGVFTNQSIFRHSLEHFSCENGSSTSSTITLLRSVSSR